MGKFQELLSMRLKQKKAEKTNVTALAQRTTGGELSSFSGVFRINPLGNEDIGRIEEILEQFKEEEDQDIASDLSVLSNITAELRAITNQAAILHGERIKKAQKILTDYKDGAFSAYLIATYGNRQTPYNFLQYYEFYMSMPRHLHPKIDEMPRQAVYSLASRNGPDEDKEEIVEKYFFEPKQKLLQIIRSTFPLPEKDKRKINYAAQLITGLKKLKEIAREKECHPTPSEKRELEKLFSELARLLQ
jgi:hypothetical protein